MNTNEIYQSIIDFLNQLTTSNQIFDFSSVDIETQICASPNSRHSGDPFEKKQLDCIRYQIRCHIYITSKREDSSFISTNVHHDLNKCILELQFKIKSEIELYKILLENNTENVNNK